MEYKRAPAFSDEQRKTLKKKGFGVLLFMPGVSEVGRLYARLNHETWNEKQRPRLDKGMKERISHNSCFVKLPTGKDNDVAEEQAAVAIELEETH